MQHKIVYEGWEISKQNVPFSQDKARAAPSLVHRNTVLWVFAICSVVQEGRMWTGYMQGKGDQKHLRHKEVQGLAAGGTHEFEIN